MSDDEQSDEIFGRDFLEGLENCDFRSWVRTREKEIDLLECVFLEELIETTTPKDVNVVGYTDKMRDNVRFSVKQSKFDDLEMQALAEDPGMSVEQVLARARKLAQSSTSSERDAEAAAFIVTLIKGYDASS